MSVFSLLVGAVLTLLALYFIFVVGRFFLHILLRLAIFATVLLVIAVVVRHLR